MSIKHFSMADILGAQTQIDARTRLGMDIPEELTAISWADTATTEARTHKTNMDKYPLEKVRSVYFATHVETDGNLPGQNSLLSLGMVACAMETKDGKLIPLDMLKPIHIFYTELKPTGNEFDEEMQNSLLDRNELLHSGADPVAEMDVLYEWVNTLTHAYGGFANPVFVGYPLAHSWMFTYWYLMNYSRKGSPFGDNSYVDLATLFADKLKQPFGRRPHYRNGPKELMLKRPEISDSLGMARVYGGMFTNLLDL